MELKRFRKGVIKGTHQFTKVRLRPAQFWSEPQHYTIVVIDDSVKKAIAHSTHVTALDVGDKTIHDAIASYLDRTGRTWTSMEDTVQVFKLVEVSKEELIKPVVPT
jgi:hypothetical protein